MQKAAIFSALMFLLSCPALAAVSEEAAASGPVDTVSTVYVVLFGVIFIGMIVGFFAYLWWSDSKKSEDK